MIKTSEELIAELLQIVSELGWNVGLPGGEADSEVHGMIIGTEEFVNEVINSYDPETEILSDTSIGNPSRKKEGMH